MDDNGVIATDTTAAGTGRQRTAGCGYGGDKGIMVGGGKDDSGIKAMSLSNLISNTGVVASDTAEVTSKRYFHVMCGYSQSA